MRVWLILQHSWIVITSSYSSCIAILLIGWFKGVYIKLLNDRVCIRVCVNGVIQFKSNLIYAHFIISSSTMIPWKKWFAKRQAKKKKKITNRELSKVKRGKRKGERETNGRRQDDDRWVELQGKMEMKQEISWCKKKERMNYNVSKNC